MLHKLIGVSILSIGVLVGSAYAHENNAYPMTFENWLLNHEHINVSEVVAEHRCGLRRGVKGQYVDIQLGNTLHIHQTLYDDSYNITVSGWLNTFAVRSGNVDIMLHHRKPVLPWNQYYSQKLPRFIEEVKRTGQFEYIYELNTHRHGHVLLSEGEGSRIVPAGFHYKVTIKDLEHFSRCFK